MIKPLLCIAVLNREWEGVYVRIGVTKRDSNKWLKSYKSEGYNRDMVSTVPITNESGKSYTLDQYREMFLYEFASFLDGLGAHVEKITDNKYKIDKSVPINDLFNVFYKDGFVIPSEVNNQEEMKQERSCLVM